MLLIHTGLTTQVGHTTTPGTTTIRDNVLQLNHDIDSNITIGYSSSTSQTVSLYRGSLKLITNASGATATTLDYYEEYTHTSLINGPWTSGNRPSADFKLQRINNKV